MSISLSHSALEIEQVLLDHPDVKECAVIGVPDDVYGEKVAAIIVPRNTKQVNGMPLLLGIRVWSLCYNEAPCVMGHSQSSKKLSVNKERVGEGVSALVS